MRALAGNKSFLISQHAHRWFASHDTCPVCRAPGFCETLPPQSVKEGRQWLGGTLQLRAETLRPHQSGEAGSHGSVSHLPATSGDELPGGHVSAGGTPSPRGLAFLLDRPAGKARLMEAEELCNELEKKNDHMENKLAETLREVSELNDELSRISETVHQASRVGPHRSTTAQSQSETGFDFDHLPPVRQSHLREIATGMVLHLVVDCLTFEDFLYNATHASNSSNPYSPVPTATLAPGIGLDGRPVNTLITANLTTKDDAYNPFNPFRRGLRHVSQGKRDGDDAVDDSDYRIPAFLIMLMIFLAALIYITDFRMKQMCARREEESQEDEDEDEDEEFELVKP
eukprot:s2353_g10.t1